MLVVIHNLVPDVKAWYALVNVTGAVVDAVIKCCVLGVQNSEGGAQLHSADGQEDPGLRLQCPAHPEVHPARCCHRPVTPLSGMLCFDPQRPHLAAQLAVMPERAQGCCIGYLVCSVVESKSVKALQRVHYLHHLD